MTHEQQPSQARGVLQTLMAAVAIGTLGPVAGLAYQAGLTPAIFSALRAAIGAGVLGAIVASGRQPRVRLASLPRRQMTMLTAAVVVNGLMSLALFLAYGETSVALVLVLFYLYPGITAVGAAALGRERLTRTRLAALGVAALGLALVLGSQIGPDAHVTPVGVALACFAAVCHATYFLLVRDGFPNVPAAQTTFLVLVGGVVISGSVALIAEGAGVVGSWLGSPAAWVAVLIAGTVGAAFPKVLIIRGVRTIGSTRAALVMLMEPLTGVVVAAIVLGQTLTPAEIVGGTAILVAAAAVQRRDPRAETETPVAAEVAASR